jgi:lauroyl/myristoyl acyltransferase
MFLFKNSNFSENLGLLPWVQKNLLPFEIKESTCERKGELKIKLEKERMRATKRNLENFKKEKKPCKGEEQ